MTPEQKTVIQDVGRLEGQVTLILQGMQNVEASLKETGRLLTHIDAKVGQIEPMKDDIRSLKRKVEKNEEDIRGINVWKNRLIGGGTALGVAIGFFGDKIWRLFVG